MGTLVQQLGLARDRIQVQAAGSATVTAGTMAARSAAPDGIMVSLLVPDDQAAAAMEAFGRHGGRVDGETQSQAQPGG